MPLVQPINLHLELPTRVDHRLPPYPATTISVSTSNQTSTEQADYNLSELEKLQVLGHGNGGTVYKVRHKQTLAVYALKVIRSTCDAHVQRQIATAIEILRCCTDSPFVVRCHGVFKKPFGDVSILMEYMDMGTLDHLLKANGSFSESNIANVARQVLHGLEYLREKKVVHRDIKPANLLANEKMEIKIADFGVSEMMSDSSSGLCSSYVGTSAYMSPERLCGLSYDGYAGDVWSFGLTLLELYVGHYPYLSAEEKPDWATIMMAVCYGEPPTLPEDASDNFRSFIGCCLEKDASKRWTTSMLLCHPFLGSIRWLMED